MIPKTDSIADKIGHYLHKFGKFGSCTALQIRTAMEAKGHKEESIYAVMKQMRDIWLIKGDPSGYELSAMLRKHYDYAAPATAYVGEIVPSRQAQPFRPLSAKNMPSKNPLLMGRFDQDKSIKNGSTDFKSFIGFTV